VTSSPPSNRYTGFFRSPAGEVGTLPPDPDAIRKALAENDGLVWVDLLVDGADDVRLLDEVFQFHALSIEDVRNDRIDPAKIDDHGSYIFLVVQALTAYEPHNDMEIMEVDFYLGPNYVVSCHRQPCGPLLTVFESRQRVIQLMRRSAPWLLHGLLDRIVDDYLPIVDALDESIDELQNEVLGRPHTSVLQRILVAKRNSLRLRRAASPQRDIINRLARGEFPQLIPAETSMYFRDIYDHLVRIEYLIEALRDLSDGALQTYLSVISNRLNEVMRVLTAVATIILPLTLIAGVYGMNFDDNVFPAFDSSWGFPIVSGGMIALGIAMLAYFRYRRWI
jgi:magnesium transporter